MSEPVKAERITKPIQLLAAWLAGLLALNSCFLIAAKAMPVGSLESRALVIAAILNVPAFLAAVFLLQTKFRPEMQEDAYYSTYLSAKTNERVIVSKDEAQFAEVVQRVAGIEAILSDRRESDEGKPGKDIFGLTVGVNRFLDDRDAIERRLSEFGILGYTEFGGSEAPKQRVVAVSRYLSDAKRNAVLQLARELGFRQYTIYDNVAEEAEEDVLFGSYGGELRFIARA